MDEVSITGCLEVTDHYAPPASLHPEALQIPLRCLDGRVPEDFGQAEQVAPFSQVEHGECAGECGTTSARRSVRCRRTSQRRYVFGTRNSNLFGSLVSH